MTSDPVRDVISPNGRQPLSIRRTGAGFRWSGFLLTASRPPAASGGYSQPLRATASSILAICVMSVTARTKRAIGEGRDTVSEEAAGTAWRTRARKFGRTAPTC
jgi:hypothetical protein